MGVSRPSVLGQSGGSNRGWKGAPGMQYRFSSGAFRQLLNELESLRGGPELLLHLKDGHRHILVGLQLLGHFPVPYLQIIASS